MDKREWSLIEELFHEALAQPAEHRATFVESRTDSPVVRDEVLALLASHETRDDWLSDDTLGSHAPLLKLTMQLLHADAAYAGLTNTGSTLIDANPQILNSGIAGDEGGATGEAAAELGYWQAIVGERYELRSVLGRGGLGTVFCAVDNSLQRLVAIKVINGRNFDQTARNRLRRESRAAAQTSSDHLVTIHAIEERDGMPFLVMEYIPGPTLSAWIAEQQQLDPHQAAELIRQLAVGLADAHRVSLIHRDIKPSNVLLAPLRGETRSYRAKLTDFGLARTNDTADSLAAACVGTPAYMSPELIVAPEQVDTLSDIYALGATLYQCLTGVPPFSGTTIAIMRSIQFDEPLPIRRLNEAVPIDLESICLKAMSKEPRNRYPSAQSMAEDLSRFLSGQPTQARPVSRWQRLNKWMLRNKMEARLIIVSGLLALLLTIGSATSAAVLYSKNRQIVEGEQQTLTARIDQVLHCSPVALPIALQLLAPGGERFPHEQLQQVIATDERPLQERLNAAIASAVAGYPQTEFLVEQINNCRATPAQALMLHRALASDSTQAVRLISQQMSEVSRSEAEADADDQTWEQRFRLSYMAACLGNVGLLNELCGTPEQPAGRTSVVHGLPNFYGDASLVERLLGSDELEPDVISAILAGLALTDVQDWSDVERTSIGSVAAEFTQHAHAGIVAAAESMLGRWQERYPSDVALWRSLAGSTRPKAEMDHDYGSPLARMVEPGIRMVQLRPGTVRMGRSGQEIYEGYPWHTVTLTRGFEIMDREVSVQLFNQYLTDTLVDGAPTLVLPDVAISPSPEHPMQQVTWYDAAQFCNWLSQRHGLSACYHFDSTNKETQATATPAVPQVSIDWQSLGFRLPTEAEWEYACRAGAETEYFFGDNPQSLDEYGRVSNARLVSALPCGSLLPNRWGMFDVHGNVWEWCQDWKSLMNDQPLVDPRGPAEPESQAFAKVYRGSGVATLSGEPTAAARGFADPSVRYQNLGFRVARTIDE